MAKVLGILLIFLCQMALAQQPPPAASTQASENKDGEPSSREAGLTGAEQISEIQKHLQPFNYVRDDFRDPFETQGANTPLEPGQIYGPFLPLQGFRLADFKLKGLLWNVKNPVAIVRAPNGKDFRLRIKDYIGENFGYVATIREKEMVIIQTIEENDKRYSTTKVLFLE